MIDSALPAQLSDPAATASRIFEKYRRHGLRPCRGTFIDAQARCSEHIVIVGGGAAGVLTAAHLARATAGRQPLLITIVEPGTLGAGVAYSTTDVRHRLNVPANAMSAFPDDPQHFLRWLRQCVDPLFPEAGFAPRADFGGYLRDVLVEVLAAAPNVAFSHVAAEACKIVPSEGEWRVSIAGREALSANAVVLAVGGGSPATAWAPAQLRVSERFIADPWDAHVSHKVPGAAGRVLLVGAGLTMADMAMTWGSGGAAVHVVSRHGMLPLAHTDPRATKPAPPALPEELSRTAARRLIFDHIRSAANWRVGVDSLRPVTAEIWRRLDVEERIAFLAAASRRWNRVRHRVAPEVGAWLECASDSGQLTPHRGTVIAARDDGNRLVVRLSDGSTLSVDVVVNCTGPANVATAESASLLGALIRDGIVRPHPVGLGIDVYPDGSVRGAEQLPPLWTIGALRQGELWESTAIPELRTQAAALADSVVAAPRLGRV